MAEIQSVQSVPQGLLELLGMKGSGVNPRSLDSVVQANIDVRQMYALSKLSSPSASAAAGAPPVEARITVPDNEWWMLLGASTTVISDTGGMTYVAATISVSFGSQGLIPVAEENWGPGITFVAGSSVHTLPFFPPYPLVLRPGSAIAGRFYWAQPAGVTASVNLQVNVGVLS